MTNRRFYILLLAGCLISRGLTTIFYIEDPDSLRFALSMIEYDVTKLQPHFPAYPVFCFIAKIFYKMIGSYAAAFSIVGGLSTFFVILFSLKIFERFPPLQRGKYYDFLRKSTNPLEFFRAWNEQFLLVFLLFFNPLIWLMGNRYMPDLMGLACLLAAFYYLSSRESSGQKKYLGLFLAGLLAGIRLSYLPFLLPVVVFAFWDRRQFLVKLLFGIIGVAIWLLPLIWLTGWENLLIAAQKQTGGHFTEFGGTVYTEANFFQRFIKLFEGLWADGLGAYWASRHPSTIITGIGVVWAVLGGWLKKNGPHPWPLSLKERGGKSPLLLQGEGISPKESLWEGGEVRVAIISWLCYFLWIFFYQNVIYKSRHVLPLLPFLLFGIAIGAAFFLAHKRKFIRLFAIGCLFVYATNTIILAVQHKQPTAIAQIKNKLATQSNAERTIIAIPLIQYYLSSQDITANFVSVEDTAAMQSLEALSDSSEIIAIGDYRAILPPMLSQKSHQIYYHNPYVNRMWAEVDVFEFKK